MSDPIEEFEKKLKKMSLNELRVYERLLDEKIKQRIANDAPNEKIVPLILYRGILDYEIKSRTILENP